MTHSVHNRLTPVALGLGLALTLPWPALAFDSGSTGADGAFSPTVNTELQLPPDGVFNFTDVNIPSGVTVSFKPNARNTPAIILATGNITINGTMHVNGGSARHSGSAGDGFLGDDGIPGEGGPGGYRGGRGGQPTDSSSKEGEVGQGPGGGGYGYYYNKLRLGGAGGGFGAKGTDVDVTTGGATYGSPLLQPLVGGSGGGGGYSGTIWAATGGGGGAGALLLGASGTVRVNGSVKANGGNGGDSAGGDASNGAGAGGGGGSGGAIRIVATTIAGNGTIQTNGGQRGNVSIPSTSTRTVRPGGNGGVGRIRLEAETMQRSATTTPAFSFGEPAAVFMAGLPGLRIVSVAGVTAPDTPTGSGDVILPVDTPNPVTVVFETIGVPVGNTVELTLKPASGNPTTVISPAITGTTELGTTSAQITLPEGASTLEAETSYTIVASLGDQLAPYAGGERVERVQLAAMLNGASRVTLITVSGKRFTLPMDTYGKIAAMPMG